MRITYLLLSLLLGGLAFAAPPPQVLFQPGAVADEVDHAPPDCADTLAGEILCPSYSHDTCLISGEVLPVMGFESLVEQHDSDPADFASGAALVSRPDRVTPPPLRYGLPLLEHRPSHPEALDYPSGFTLDIQRPPAIVHRFTERRSRADS